MSNFNDNNVNKNINIDEHNYLDDLMKDLMQTESPEETESTEMVEDTNQKSKKEDDVIETPVETRSATRKSLFQKLGITDDVKEDDTGEDSDVIEEKSNVDSDEGAKEHNEPLSKPNELSTQEVGSDEKLNDDIFDNILQDVTEEIDDNLDPDVITPLEKPGMDEIKVTADGRTLAEMLPGMRSGNKTIEEKMKQIVRQESVIEVGGKKFTDDRYTKHIEVIDKERKEQEKRIALSKRFLQRNAEFTEEEKIIMKNLGLTNKEYANIMKSKELSRKDKEALLGLGRYGAEKHFKGRRYRTTVGDQAMLEFLIKFKFANTRILKWMSNEPQGRTWRKLDRLRNSGLVESKTIIGIPDLWAATPAGVGVAGYPYQPGLRPMPKMLTISATLGVNYIASCLWFNSVNVLNLDDFPAHNRIIALQEDGVDRVRGENLVSELEIRSSLGKEINPQSTTMQTLGDEKLYDVISSNVRAEFEAWVRNGRIGDSPEFHLGNEYMWILFPTSQLTLSYHVPDLVVKRERGLNGEPRSIAVEMERYDKSNDRYDKIMLAYKLDEHLYEKVVWITPNTRVARALEAAAKQVGFENYSIIPIITETGTYDKPDIWLI